MRVGDKVRVKFPNCVYDARIESTGEGVCWQTAHLLRGAGLVPSRCVFVRSLDGRAAGWFDVLEVEEL